MSGINDSLTPAEARRAGLKESAIQQADTWWNLKSRDSIEQPATAHVAELVAQVIMPLLDDLLQQRTVVIPLPAVFECATRTEVLEIRAPDGDDEVPVIIRGAGTVYLTRSDASRAAAALDAAALAPKLSRNETNYG